MEKINKKTDNAIVLDGQRPNRIKLIIEGDTSCWASDPSRLTGKENMIITDNIILTPEQYSEVYKKLNEIYVLLNSWRYA